MTQERPTRILGDYSRDLVHKDLHNVSRLPFCYFQSNEVVSIINRYNEAAVPNFTAT